jgi:hypothetical protein
VTSRSFALLLILGVACTSASRGGLSEARVPLRIQAFMDDVNTPDLYFFTTRELAAEIQREMTAYGEEAGL